MTRHILKILILAISLLLTSGFGQGKLSQRDSLNAQLPNAKPREKMQIYLKLGELSEGKSYAQRISYFREALSLAQKFKSKQDEIKALNQIGELYYYSGDDKQAIQYTEEALHLGTSISDSKQVQVSLYNLGFIHQVLHNHEVAIDYFLKTLAIANEASDIEMSTRTLVSLGKSYHILKRYPEALDVYNQAKLQSIDIDNNAILGRIYSGIGDLYQIIGEYDKAIAYFDIVISINKKLENKPALAQNYCDIGIAYFHLMQYDQAETYFQKAIQNSQNDEFITNNFKLIADTYYESGRFEKAIQFYRLYTTQKDSLFNKEKQKAINDLQMAYENEKKDRKIFELMVDQENNTFTLKQRRNFLITSFSFLVLMAITLVLLFLRNNDKQKANIDLQKKSDKIAHQTAELEELIAELKSVNRTKDSLFSIIAHDLRGPLGVMKAWLDILADDQDFKNTDEYRQVVTDLKHSAGTTFTLLENLLSWARSQRDEIQYKPSINGLKYIALTNMDLLKSGANEKGVTLLCDMPDELEAFFDLETIQVVIRNLISNAIKFTKKDGSVTVSGEANEENVVVLIRDTGIGMDQKTIESIHNAHEKVTSTRGTNNEKGTGLGLVICKDFVAHNKGELTIESELNKGTTIQFTLPLS